jgi:branched-chain amino acid transport system ATP-binding protein/urea transport system ATP-binding protein
MIVETSDLWRTFGGVAAVAGVNFRLEPGELRCLIGSNGAGKSTFFKLLTGQLRPSKGHISILGRQTTTSQPFEISRLGVGIKTQVPSLFEGLSVRENLHLAARRTHAGKAARLAAEAMLEDIELADRAGAPVRELSHGQRQWVELGMVLVSEPKLVLLDEPAAGMTQAEVEHTAMLLQRMRKDRAFIIVEHDMHFVRNIAERVTVFHRGRILVEDTMEAVTSNAEVRNAYLGQKFGKDHD